MRKNNNDKKSDDLFDRMFFGSPGTMIVIILGIIIVRIIVNYFK